MLRRVLIMARAPRRGEVRRALEPVLGADALRGASGGVDRQRAALWALSVAGPLVHVAHEPPDAAPELRPLVGSEVSLFPQNGDGIAGRLADAAARVFVHHDGPLLIVWPDLPRMRDGPRRRSARRPRGGVRRGPRPGDRRRLLPDRNRLARSRSCSRCRSSAWRSPDVMTIGLAAARDAGLEIGLLRAERALHRPADVRAALADPLLPAEVGQILVGQR